MDYWMDEWLNYHKKREENIVTNEQTLIEDESWIWKLSKYWERLYSP